jgi:hemerythrin-like domain-containing protein
MLRIALVAPALFAVFAFALFAREHQHQEPDSTESAPRRQILKEHDVTLLIVQSAEQEVKDIRAGGEANVARIRKMLDFFQSFTDQCHHAKEERYLFPVARAWGGRETDALLDELLNEHKRARMDLQVVSYLLETEPAESADMVADRLASYARLIRAHIKKENRLLMPGADARVPADEMEAVMVAFERLEKVELGEGFHEKYHELAMELSGREK